jgi:hypothetical protein
MSAPLDLDKGLALHREAHDSIVGENRSGEWELEPVDPYARNQSREIHVYDEGHTIGVGGKTDTVELDEAVCWWMQHGPELLRLAKVGQAYVAWLEAGAEFMWQSRDHRSAQLAYDALEAAYRATRTP